MASVPKEMSIYHEVDSTLFTPGHACYMLIHKSLIEEEDALQPNTVYLMSTQIGEKFPPLKDALSSHNSLLHRAVVFFPR